MRIEYLNRVFNLLCYQLKSIGELFGWNNQTASVYTCIHLWPLLCVIMVLVMLAFAISTSNPLWIIVCVIYTLFNIFGYWAIIKHYYSGTFDKIFIHCYSDLMAIAKEWKTTYAVVNLFIYVVLFMVIMVFDVSLIILMR